MRTFQMLSALLLALFSLSVHAQLTFSDATVRLLPPGLPNTSAYMTVENTSDKDIAIVAASADFVERVELHNHIMKGDVMRMEQQDEVIIPAGETVHFAPGGLHLMLFGLTEPLKEDQEVSFDVKTKQGETFRVSAKVVMPGQEKGKQKHHHHHH